MENKSKKIKYYELFNISKGLQDLNGISGVQLGIYRGKLSRSIAEYITDAQSYSKTEEWERIDKLVNDINLKHCTKNDNGEPIITNNRYSFSKDVEVLRLADIKEFQEIEKEAIAERDRLQKEFVDLLDKETPYEVLTIPYSVIEGVENVYIKLGKPSPFKSETIDLLTSIIDMET